jgi:hypothetical protein
MSNEKTPWGHTDFPGPSVAEAKALMFDDPRFTKHGVERVSGDGFTGTIWKIVLFEAKVTFEDGAEETLQASSAHDLNAELLRVRDALLAEHRQATVDVLPQRVAWLARLEFSDGSIETAEAPDRDLLLQTLLAWKGHAEDRPEEPAVAYQSPAEIQDAASAQVFMDLCPGYRATAENWAKLKAFLHERGLSLSTQTLFQAYDAINDAGGFDE